MIDYSELERYWIHNYREGDFICFIMYDRAARNESIDYIKFFLPEKDTPLTPLEWQQFGEFHEKCRLLNWAESDRQLYDEIVKSYVL